MADRIAQEVLKTLVQSHDQFLRFLQSRVGNRDAAEEVLQAAFVKTFERGEEIRNPDSAVGWFYRVLRNELADHYRRHAADVRARESKLSEAASAVPEDPELEKAICRCLKEIIPTLKEEYADILQKVELEGAPVADVAKSENITPNNAMVRLHRARKALHGRLVQTCGTCTKHGCLDCHCRA